MQEGWVKTSNTASYKYGVVRGNLIANAWLKKKINPKTRQRAFIKFKVDETKRLISRDKDGNDYLTLVLSSTSINRDGNRFTEKDLKKWEKQINTNPIVGDIDHELYYKLQNYNLSNETIESMLKEKKGIAKTLKAIYQKGKLWVKVFIDKRYKAILNKVKGVSVEAAGVLSDNQEKDWDILGFTFNVNTTPADNLAGVVA